MKNLYTFLTLLLIGASTYAQTGTIKGNIKDAATGEAIIGGTVLIQGTSFGAATDVEGNFTIGKVQSGTHTLAVTFISYENKTISNVTVEANKTTVINTTITQSAQELQAVEVLATRQKDTDIAVITEIKQAEQVAVGVSSQQISKSQDRDAAQVIRRIPGISIIDDRFVMVRGLSERYNAVMLNDALTPSSEIDVKAFSFDIIPSNAIDRLLIFKSGAPELPGEFAGGVIKIYTKNVPDRNSITFGVSGSYRQGSTFNNFYSNKGSSTDFLGFDNGYRALPSGFPEEINNSEAQLAQIRKMPNNWKIHQSTASPDLRLNLGITRKFNVGNVRIGNITSISYSNTSQVIEKAERYRFENTNPETLKSDTTFKYYDNQYINAVRVGVLHNWSFSLSPNNKIEFRNLFNQFGLKETVIRNGVEYTRFPEVSEVQNFASRYESRSIYMGQLNGTHDLTDLTVVKWTAGFSHTNRNEPDFKRIRTNRPLNSESPFEVLIPQSATTYDAARFYSKLKESTATLSGNIEHKINMKNSEENQAKIRGGFYLESKKRDFNARWMSYNKANESTFDNSITDLPIGEIFSEENIRTPDGLILKEGTNPDDHYSASNLLAAAYIGTYIPLNDKINISGGVRAEYNVQELDSRTRGGQAVKPKNSIFRPLPSINVAYNFSKKSLIRLAYSVTLNRPEFRELAPFSYYDFNFDVGIAGNPKLKTPSIHNIDVRYEFYPTESEVISIGAFYKRFINPIEVYIRSAGSGVSFTYDNPEYAQSQGLEAEFRKSLVNVSDFKFVQDLTVVLNASVINSKVDLGGNAGNQDKIRPMMGQSPYLVNAGLYYNNEQAKLNVNLLYNVIGKRIFTVGDISTPTIYEMPRNVIDLNITKSIGQHLDIKAGFQDLLNQRTRLMYDTDANRKITSIDQKALSFKRGTYSTIGISYKF